MKDMSMNKKRILIVNDVVFAGGVETLMYDLTNAWHDKYNITILSNFKEKSFFNKYPTNVEYHYRFINIFTRFETLNNFIEKLFFIPDLIKRKKFDKYDCAIAIKDNKVISYVSKLKCKKKFGWFHTDINTNKLSQHILQKKYITTDMLLKFDKIFCVSEQCKKSVIDNYGDTKNLIVQYNPVDVKRIISLSKEPINLPKTNKIRFVTVGALIKAKGMDLLIDAVNKLNEEGYELELYIVGLNTDQDGLQTYLKNIDCKCIHVTGNVDNPYPYIKSADWYISASRSEGYSFSIQEAAVLNVPLMLTDVSGTRELLGSNGEYGIIMKITAESIHSDMKDVLVNLDKQKYYRNKIIQRKQIITYEKQIKIIEEIINDKK